MAYLGSYALSEESEILRYEVFLLKGSEAISMATVMATRSPRAFEKEMKVVDGEIPIRLTLGDTTLSLGVSGHWELDSATLQQAQERVQELEKRNAVLEVENTALRNTCARMTEESNMEKFKCQLLVEVLAVSSLDEERTRVQTEKEKARAISLKTDVEAEQARVEGLDARTLSATLATELLPGAP